MATISSSLPCVVFYRQLTPCAPCTPCTLPYAPHCLQTTFGIDYPSPQALAALKAKQDQLEKQRQDTQVCAFAAAAALAVATVQLGGCCTAHSVDPYATAFRANSSAQHRPTVQTQPR